MVSGNPKWFFVSDKGVSSIFYGCRISTDFWPAPLLRYAMRILVSSTISPLFPHHPLVLKWCFLQLALQETGSSRERFRYSTEPQYLCPKSCSRCCIHTHPYYHVRSPRQIRRWERRGCHHFFGATKPDLTGCYGTRFSELFERSPRTAQRRW